jgi:hypothetical protein
MSQVMETLRRLADGVAEGQVIPYLGPEVLTLTPGGSPVPATPAALCAQIEAKVTVPRRAKGNLWAAAQFVEQRKFRAALAAIMKEAFAATPRANPLHQWLAGVRPPLVVDTWYDNGMQAALSANGKPDWGMIQAITQSQEWYCVWTRAVTPSGEFAADATAAESWKTVLYKPHGAVHPQNSFLLSDADYVEVLTEIDIQTPIPDEVKRRRTGRGFLFLGCRFDDQTLRIFARQIIKRSGGPHYAVINGPLTRMEERFLAEHQVTRIDVPLTQAAEALRGASVSA